ncbi:hypothetical protein PSENEW3_00006106 [Picochlorum sp. SENEW3]|nr:hypothetical protein PSENEW3_00006106 [Picochlorum sp. SENEW3]
MYYILDKEEEQKEEGDGEQRFTTQDTGLFSIGGDECVVGGCENMVEHGIEGGAVEEQQPKQQQQEQNGGDESYSEKQSDPVPISGRGRGRSPYGGGYQQHSPGRYQHSPSGYQHHRGRGGYRGGGRRYHHVDSPRSGSNSPRMMNPSSNSPRYYQQQGGSRLSGGGHQTPVSTPPPPPPRSPMVVTDGWQYQDPEGDVHGPYLASKIVNWVDKGYFSDGLPVRKVTKEGSAAWGPLKFVLSDLRREAALTIVPNPDKIPIQEQSSPVVAVKPPPPPVAAKETVPEREQRKVEVPPPQPSADRWEKVQPSRTRFNDRWNANDDRARRGGGRGRNQRGNRTDRGRGRGRGGRGGRGRGGSTVDPDLAEAVHKLFSGDVDQGADQPMWRYIDYEGVTQGPFPAKSMIEWFQGGYLSDSTIPVCGTERKVSPPNLPPNDFYIPLGALIYWARRGNHFKPVTVADIQSKTLPEELAALKESAAKAFEGVDKEKKVAADKATAKQKDDAPPPVLEQRESSKLRSPGDISWAEAEELESHDLLEDDEVVSRATDEVTEKVSSLEVNTGDEE